ncbi:MAG: hypothetical protein AAFS12_00945 [Cyanobacteria bacterium J06632_19]
MAIIKCDSGVYQHIYGGIGEDGNTFSGEGFKSQRLTEGLYVVEFDTPFANMPAVVCTINGEEWKTFNLSVANLDFTPHYFVCGTSSPNNRVSSAFTFIAFGQV